MLEPTDGHGHHASTSDPPPPGLKADPERLRSYWSVGRVTRYVVSLGLAGFAIYVVAGRTDELSGASGYLENLRWYCVALAVVAEAASLTAYAGLQRQLLLAGRVRLNLVPLTGITLAGTAIQNSLPGGPAFSAVFAFRQFRHRGADEVLAGWTLLGTTALSMIALVALAGVGLGAAAGTGSAYDLVGVIAGMVVLVIVVMAVWSRRNFVLRHLVRPLRLSQRLFHRPRVDASTVLEDAIRRMAVFAPSRPDWILCAAYALANWVLDIGCLILAFWAVRSEVPWRALLLAYAAAQLAANLPITPGGLGVVEGSLTIALVAYGGGEAATVAAVLLYRLINFWAMLPVGWTSWGVMNWDLRRRERPRSPETRPQAPEAVA